MTDTNIRPTNVEGIPLTTRGFKDALKASENPANIQGVNWEAVNSRNFLAGLKTGLESLLQKSTEKTSSKRVEPWAVQVSSVQETGKTSDTLKPDAPKVQQQDKGLSR